MHAWCAGMADVYACVPPWAACGITYWAESNAAMICAYLTLLSRSFEIYVLTVVTGLFHLRSLCETPGLLHVILPGIETNNLYMSSILTRCNMYHHCRLCITEGFRMWGFCVWVCVTCIYQFLRAHAVQMCSVCPCLFVVVLVKANNKLLRPL